MAEKKSKITIGPDGSIHVDGEEEPGTSSDTSIDPDGTIHIHGEEHKSETSARQSDKSPKQKAKQENKNPKVKASAEAGGTEHGDESQNPDDSSDSEGCFGCVFIIALIAAAAYAQFGLGIPIIGVLGMAFGLWAVVVFIKALFK